MTFRIENKFILPKSKVFEFKNFLKINNFKILFPKRLVNSLYFDNSNLSMYLDSLEGTVPRKKIRIRTYSKHFFHKENVYNLETKVSSVEGRFKTSSKIKDINKTLNGIFDKQYGPCKPILNVIYEREYFTNKVSRITIDQNIKYFKLIGKKISNFPKLETNCVIENKSKYLSQNTIMEFFMFDNKRFSKYSNGIEKTQ